MNTIRVNINVATCFRCGSSIFETESTWLHRDKNTSRGCRLATYNPETGYYNDALGARFLAAPDKSTIHGATVEITRPTPPLKTLLAEALDLMEWPEEQPCA